MWEERYATDDYVFGKAPARFLTEHQALLRQHGDCIIIGGPHPRNSLPNEKELVRCALAIGFDVNIHLIVEGPGTAVLVESPHRGLE